MIGEAHTVKTSQLHLVHTQDYDKLRPIFSRMAGIHLNIVAVLEGNSSGVVYVDNAGAPATACLVFGGAFYLVGNPHNHTFNGALAALLPRDTYFVLFPETTEWDETLSGVLADTYAVRAKRRYYSLAQNRTAEWQDRVPDGFTVRPIDAELLASGLVNGDGVEDGILDEWRSLSVYLAHGFGFCLVHRDTIASWSCTDYVSGERCEIGINTAWKYRRRGLGTLAAAATAAQALARGFTQIGWHCWDNNVGSIGVAENVGFEQEAAYDVFINHWTAENITDMSQEEFRAFAQDYERAFEVRPPSSGFPHVVAAKAWALSGDRPGCFRQLNQAADLGWLCSVDQLREIWPEFFWNPELDEISEWQDLAARLGG
jgi:hypothetical protein